MPSERPQYRCPMCRSVLRAGGYGHSVFSHDCPGCGAALLIDEDEGKAICMPYGRDVNKPDSTFPVPLSDIT